MSTPKHAGLVDIPAMQEIARAAAPEPAAPDGFKLIAVRGFDELVYWLGRCDAKGHLENCPDLVQPWTEFDWREVSPAAARVPLKASHVMSALALCPTDLSHPARCAWIAARLSTAAGQEGGAA